MAIDPKEIERELLTCTSARAREVAQLLLAEVRRQAKEIERLAGENRRLSGKVWCQACGHVEADHVDGTCGGCASCTCTRFEPAEELDA